MQKSKARLMQRHSASAVAARFIQGHAGKPAGTIQKPGMWTRPNME